MKLSPLILIGAASAATFAVGQVRLPTADAQTPASYRVRVEGLKAKRTSGGVEVTGRIVNTGSRTLTYTSAAAVLTDADGKEAVRCSGYLTAGPLQPGESAEFRACALEAPAFTRVTLRLSEAGNPVIVAVPSLIQASARRRTTVW